VGATKRDESREQMSLPFGKAGSALPSPPTREGQVLQFQATKSAPDKREGTALRLLLDKAAKLTW
jgi:hypothetical protein